MATPTAPAKAATPRPAPIEPAPAAPRAAEAPPPAPADAAPQGAVPAVPDGATILPAALPDPVAAPPPPPAVATAVTAPARGEAPQPQSAPLHRAPMSEAAQQVAQHAVTAATDGVDSISVDLRPPELGRVELRLTFQDGTVQVAMAAERSDTFEALRQDRASLEQQMQQAGLQLGTGGLDLQHGRLPRPVPDAPATPRWTAEAGNSAEEIEATRPPRSDSLIDLIA